MTANPCAAADALRCAAEALYRSPRGHVALDALGRAAEALDVIRSAAEDPEVARAAGEIADARTQVAAGREPEVRAAANRLCASAVILLEPHRTWQATHLMLLRVVLRDVLGRAEARAAPPADRLALGARAACRSLGLDETVARSSHHVALERTLAAADAASRSGQTALLLESVRDALRLVDELEAELARDGVVGTDDRDAPAQRPSGALRDASSCHGS
jgi:hypothetical protein